MELEELVRNYGYIIIAVGTFLEGETILIVAGFLAHSGYLQLPFVIIAGFAGLFSVTNCIFMWDALREGNSSIKNLSGK